MKTAITIKECGRGFSAGEMEAIRAIIQTAIPALRAQIAREVCEELGLPRGRVEDRLRQR